MAVGPEDVLRGVTSYREAGRWRIYLLEPAPSGGESAAHEQAMHWEAQLDAAALRGNLLHTEVFVHFWRISIPPVAQVYQDHVSTWRPQLGLGIWPDRPAPASWTQETFMDAAAAMLSGQEVPLTAYKLVRLSCDVRERRNASRLLAGHGSTTRFWSSEDFATVAERLRPTFLEHITSPLRREERFYIPLLSPNLAGTATPEQMDAWFEGIGLYMHEVAATGAWVVVEDRKAVDLTRLAAQPPATSA